MGFFALLTNAFGVRFQSSLRTDDQVFGDDYFRVEEQVSLGTEAMLVVPRHFQCAARPPKKWRWLGCFLPRTGLITRADSNCSGGRERR